MSYSVQHIRYTLECDACGLTEKRDLDVDSEKGTAGWDLIRVENVMSRFCCPSCVAAVTAVLCKKEREEFKARQDKQAACEHDYQPRGLLAQCTKCEMWKP